METPRQIFLIFLRLGCIAFGGPTAHLSFFHDEFVVKRKWLADGEYADLIALCQFLPGPGSSQVGLSLGFLRGGKRGALAAWFGFTLPSALILIVLAWGLATFGANVPSGLLTGLKIVAVAVVAKALWLMTKKLCPDWPRVAIALVTCVAVLSLMGKVSGVLLQIALILVFGLLGVLIFRAPTLDQQRLRSLPNGSRYLVVFVLLLIALPLIAIVWQNAWVQMTDAFYRTGSMVFGGGHVVLPLLRAETVAMDWVSEDTFLAGYGATQAVPGPLFTFSAFLGTSMLGVGGGVVALLAIYVPSFLLIFGVLPMWQKLQAFPKIRSALMGINACVVGLLLASLWNPMIVNAFDFDAEPVRMFAQLAFALLGLLALTKLKCSPWLVVVIAAAVGTLFF